MRCAEAAGAALHAGNLRGAGLLLCNPASRPRAQLIPLARHWRAATSVPTLPPSDLAPLQCAGVRPTAHTVNLLLGTLVASGQALHALVLAREAVRCGYDLGTPAFSALLQLLAGRGDWEAAVGLHRAMGQAGPKSQPDATSAALVVAACVQGGNPPLAAQLARELAAQGLLQQSGPPPGPAPVPAAPAYLVPARTVQHGAAAPALPMPMLLPASPAMDGPGHSGRGGRQRGAPGSGGGFGPAATIVTAAAGGAYNPSASFASVSSESSPKGGSSSHFGSTSLSNASFQMDGV